MPPASKAKRPAKVQTPAKAKSQAKSESPRSLALPLPLQTVKASPQANVSTRSKTKASISIAAAIEDVPIPLTEFTIFGRLPPELQLMVWRHSHFSRIVTLKPSKSQLPALLHACSDSRKECILAGYKINIRDMETGLVINPWKDILFLDKDSFSASMSYHINSFHIIRCKEVNSTMLEPVQKLAFSVREVMEIWRTQCFHCFLMTKLSESFPNLKELIIILRPGPIGAAHDDLYEVTDCPSLYLKNAISDVQRTFKAAQDEGKCMGIQLKMMRMENWTS